MPITQDEIEELAEFMHDEYDKASVARGWQTQFRCRVKFWDLPEKNRLVMLDLAAQVLLKLRNKKREENHEYKIRGTRAVQKRH